MTRAMFQEGRMTGEPARLQRRRRIPGRHHEQLQSIKWKGGMCTPLMVLDDLTWLGGQEGSDNDCKVVM